MTARPTEQEIAEQAWNDGFTAGYTEAFEKYGNPAPMPGMETTARPLTDGIDRSEVRADAAHDLASALAEIARLTAENRALARDRNVVFQAQIEIARLTTALAEADSLIESNIVASRQHTARCEAAARAEERAAWIGHQPPPDIAESLLADATKTQGEWRKGWPAIDRHLSSPSPSGE